MEILSMRSTGMRQRWEKEAGQNVTYEVLRKNWFVLSGIDKRRGFDFLFEN